MNELLEMLLKMMESGVSDTKEKRGHSKIQ